MVEQLDMFNDVTNESGKRDLKPIDFTAPIGMFKELDGIRGVDKLSEKALETLHYLVLNHARPEDGFIHSKQLAFMLNIFDTRELRKYLSEIDMVTDVVIYTDTARGHKIASSAIEIELAIKKALAPVLTSIERVIAKAKTKNIDKMLQGYIGNVQKLYDCVAQGQQVLDKNGDGELEQKEINHYPPQPFVEYMPPIDERIKAYEKRNNKSNKR